MFTIQKKTNFATFKSLIDFTIAYPPKSIKQSRNRNTYRNKWNTHARDSARIKEILSSLILWYDINLL